MLGLAFKPETDDMREAPSIKIARSLTKLGAEVVAYDPVAIDNAKKILGDTIGFASSVREAVDADAVFIVTEWNEFRTFRFETLITTMKQPIVFDGRNCFDEDKIRACAKVEYYPIGKKAVII